MKAVEIYTDGACSGNPGNGGWAAILKYKEIQKEISGSEPKTTNNRMELFAVINALNELKEECEVSIFSDSRYVIDSVERGWLEKWQSNGWRTSTGKEVKNQDLWLQLVAQSQFHKLKLVKVPAHADNELNNRCDALAKNAAEMLGKITNNKK